jgi:hypothetical protein
MASLYTRAADRARLARRDVHPLWNLLQAMTRRRFGSDRKFLCECRSLLGGRTRTRTLDPLIN